MLPAVICLCSALFAFGAFLVGLVLGWPGLALGVLAGASVAGVGVAVWLFRLIDDDTRNLLPER